MRPSTAKRTENTVPVVCVVAEHEVIVAEAVALLHIYNHHERPNISEDMDAFIAGGLTALNANVSQQLVASFKTLANALERKP